MDAVPLLGALIVAQPGMQDGHLLSEDAMEICRRRRCKSDLWYQQDRRSARRQHTLHRRKVDRRLSRPRYTMQQRDRKLLPLKSSGHMRERGKLLRVQLKI